MRCFHCLAVVILLTGCSPLSLANAVLVPHEAEVDWDVAYGPLPRQRLDVYRPPDPLQPARPIVVFFYGGGWDSGERGDYRFVGEALSAAGFVAVVPDYRLYPQVRFPAFVQDGAAAVAWARANAAAYGGDPRRLVLAGHSAGAHIAALLATVPRWRESRGLSLEAVRGVVGLAGPYAFHPQRYPGTKDIFAGLDDEDLARPIAQVGPASRPMVLLHGLADRTVQPRNSLEMAEALRANGVAAQVETYEGVGHVGLLLGFYPLLPSRAPVTQAVRDAVQRLSAPAGEAGG